MNTANGLNIYNFLDYREFLTKLYELRKNEDQSFSYAVWAKEAGFSSRSFIRLIIIGKRNLTLKSLEQIMPSLKLKKREDKYFRSLVLFNQSSTAAEREIYWKEVLKNIDTKEANYTIDTYSFLSSQWCPKIVTLTTYSDLDRSIEAISKAFNLSSNDVEKHLETLENLGMVYEEDGQWCSTQTNYIVNSDHNNLAMQSYYRNSLLQAIECIELDPTERFFNGILISLTEEQYSEVSEDIKHFITMIRGKYGSKSGKNKRLYQLNINNVPQGSKYIHLQSEDAPVLDERTINQGEIQ